MPSWREQLIATRPDASSYIQSIEGLGVESLQGSVGFVGIAPIKSLGMLALDGARLTRTGLATLDGGMQDRAMMFVYESPGERYTHERFSQREESCLALVRCVSYDGRVLRYVAPGMRDLTVYKDQFYPRKGHPLQTLMSAQTQEIVPVTPEAHGAVTDWVREFLGHHGTGRIDPARVQAVVMPFAFRERAVDAMHQRETLVQTLLTDGGYALATSRSTLKWMQTSLSAQHGPNFRDISMDAFRPNIVLEGLPPNSEDLIDSIEFCKDGKCFKILFGGLCIRCAVTTVDSRTGRKPDAEPLKFLSKQRPARPDKPNSTTFGVNVAASEEAEGTVIKPGDTFRVVAQKE